MSGEYPNEKEQNMRQDGTETMTRAQRWQNWWDYHLGWVIFGILIAIGAFFLIRDMFFRPEPDYQVGYVSRTPLPQEVRSNLEEQLAALGEDVNGDGQIVVELISYELGFDTHSMLDVDMTTAATTSLTVDLSSGNVYLLLLADPEGFQARMGALCYLDGTVPPVSDPIYGASDWQQMVYLWEDCPVLHDMDLGTYQQFWGAEEDRIDGQSVMTGVYIGRRAVWDNEQEKNFAADERLWRKLTEGAAALSGI